MKAPFELPIQADEELLMLHIQGRLCASLIIGDVDNWNDESRLAYLRYIVQCVNSHDALLDALKQAVCGNMGWKGIAEDVIAQAEKEG